MRHSSVKERGLARRLVGFEMVDRGIARHGYPVVRSGEAIGVVTSGAQTPYSRKAIGMAYVPIDLSKLAPASRSMFEAVSHRLVSCPCRSINEDEMSYPDDRKYQGSRMGSAVRRRR